MAVKVTSEVELCDSRDLEARRDRKRFRERKMPCVFGGGGRKTWIIKAFWSEKLETNLSVVNGL